VGSLVFKTCVPVKNWQAGSIPVPLRKSHACNSPLCRGARSLHTVGEPRALGYRWMRSIGPSVSKLKGLDEPLRDRWIALTAPQLVDRP
jgi:hypothetical protein